MRRELIRVESVTKVSVAERRAAQAATKLVTVARYAAFLDLVLGAREREASWRSSTDPVRPAIGQFSCFAFCTP